jgi:predicted Zn-dependent protease
MGSLEHPDGIRLSAAQGWFELGSCVEALAELNSISAAAQEHPDVLELRWQIAERQHRWEDGLAVAEALCRLTPDSPFGCIHRSYCLHELKRTQDAWDALLPCAEKFPREWLICYNLACYACQLGRVEEAKRWFSRSLDLGDAREIESLAAEDPDLKPLRET